MHTIRWRVSSTDTPIRLWLLLPYIFVCIYYYNLPMQPVETIEIGNIYRWKHAIKHALNHSMSKTFLWNSVMMQHFDTQCELCAVIFISSWKWFTIIVIILEAKSEMHSFTVGPTIRFGFSLECASVELKDSIKWTVLQHVPFWHTNTHIELHNGFHEWRPLALKS